MNSPHQSGFEQGLAALPEALREIARMHWAEIAPQLERSGRSGWQASAAKVLACSEFVARACLSRPGLLAELIDSGDLQRAASPVESADRMRAALADCVDELALKGALRRLRQREMVCIAWRDISGWANLDETVHALSALAEVCLDGAQKKLREWAVARDGVPRATDSKAPAQWVVLGMGKLGGQELNFSSDIDLIFAYSDEGETDKRGLSNHEFFVRLGQRLNQALDEATADGFVFRVDMRLRPYGDSGPLVMSFAALEGYLVEQGDRKSVV